MTETHAHAINDYDSELLERARARGTWSCRA